ncbi:hypothetical protein GT021_22325 [Streptomyces sp. SID5470]|uniref:Uncharacterized protein n=1 Tax=Streptomyces sviceus (strain ATCC 29083 / DSM 924 / JCM 4929 / NBRC 13980 / NCIMB 11184 / NRRL 5439 / UC 5370) TaxID=463191 RepID=D6XAH7_STRX2|nr:MULTISPECIES: DUF5819 family protein [Streptomyces]EFH28736.1 conserved hypothetical protein [Streptomyces sviceus ATCC 29083]MYT07118.1 hypothetical protein [Streptomyces sp. SID5470]
MDAYDGGSNARRGPGATSGSGDAPGPGDAPEPEVPAEAYGSHGANGPEAPGELPDVAVESRTRVPAQDRESAGVGSATSDLPAETGHSGLSEPAHAGSAEPAHPGPSQPADTRPSAIRPAAPAPAPDLAPYRASDPEPRTGVGALSLRYQIGVALALAVVAVAVCVHIGMVFLHVAPSNTVTKQHGGAVEDWVYPEFEQNWKLFAPNPLQLNIAVQVRARVRSADGGSRTTGWYDLSAEDGRAVDGNLLPSHTQQNELRRSWDLFVATHDADNRPVGLRGTLSGTYLRRIVVLRLERDHATARGDVLVSVQVRSRTTNVPPPKWSEEKVPVQPVYRELPWWAVTADDTEGSVR